MSESSENKLDSNDMLLVGLNNPSQVGQQIDKEWSERRASSRPKTALFERRQQQLKEMKSQYLQDSKIVSEKKKETQVSKHQPEEFHPLPQRKELCYQFIEAIDKFTEQQTRDSGVGACMQLIEKNKDLQSLQTMIECLSGSSKKAFNPKTNTQNSLAVDMELITLGEILKQNEGKLNQYLIEKVFQIIKKNLSSCNETTVQAISFVVIQLLSQIELAAIYLQLYECLNDKSRQVQVVHVLSLLCYHLKQQNKIDDLNILAQLLFEIFSKYLIESQEFLKCIEFLIILNIAYNNEIIIQRSLRYCRVPINKSSIYYLIVAQACNILQLMGTRTRALSAEVISEMKKLINDRRIVIQTAAKRVISTWEELEIKLEQPSLDSFFSKIAYCQIPYSEYQKKGFQSFLRASSFVRKNSRSPSLPKQNQKKPIKIREKIKKMHSGPPQFQVLDEDDHEKQRIEALSKLKQKQTEKLFSADEQFEDSLENVAFSKNQNLNALSGEQDIILEQVQQEELGSIQPQQNQQNQESFNQLSKMPSIQYIDNVQTIKQSLHEASSNANEIQQDIQTNNQGGQEIILPSIDQVNYKIKDQVSNTNLSKSIQNAENQFQFNNQPSPGQNKYQKIEQQKIKVQASVGSNQDEELSLQFEEDANQVNLAQQTIFPIKEITNFQASFQEFPIEFKTTNNNINYQLELQEEQNDQQDILSKDLNDNKEYKKIEKQVKVKSALEPEQEIKELELSNEALDKSSEEIKVPSGQKAQKRTEEVNTHNIFSQKEIPKETSIEQQEIEQIKEVLVSQEKSHQQLENKQSVISKNNQMQCEQQQPNINKLQIQDRKSEDMIPKKEIPSSQQYFQMALSRMNENINDAYQILFENCDDLQKIHFMMVAGPQIGKLNSKILNNILQFMQKIKQAELLNILGISFYSQIKECNFFDEINHKDLQEVKEVLYEISGSEKENIGLAAVNLYNEL